jgi:hypothetical protein
MSLRLLQPAVDDQRGLHFLHNVPEHAPTPAGASVETEDKP